MCWWIATGLNQKISCEFGSFFGCDEVFQFGYQMRVSDLFPMSLIAKRRINNNGNSYAATDVLITSSKDYLIPQHVGVFGVSEVQRLLLLLSADKRMFYVSDL
eukprot:m.133637 g.133637  ORF g.133637 m.133637 type:complete len:103 (+) comp29685_c7_seq1:1756-2064(+)